MGNEAAIYDYYFNHKLNTIEIAEKLKISKQAVSKQLKKFGDTYLKEKENRKSENQRRHKQETIEYISNKRKTDRQEDKELYIALKLLHDQDVRSMSKKGKITNLDMVIRNFQEYDLNAKKTRLVFNEQRAGACPCGIPKSISVHIIR